MRVDSADGMLRSNSDGVRYRNELKAGWKAECKNFES